MREQFEAKPAIDEYNFLSSLKPFPKDIAEPDLSIRPQVLYQLPGCIS